PQNNLAARPFATNLPPHLQLSIEGMTRMIPTRLLAVICVALFGFSAQATAQTIPVAVAGPMTGGESAFGRQMRNGAEQAVADLNDAGGVLGKMLALQIGDDACDPKQARSVAEKLANSGTVFS